jgi:5-methylcytosine-specific restriction endonuclease McrA
VRDPEGVPPDQDGGAIRFAERLLALLDEGRFSATYKYAVLLALIDLSLERADDRGEPPRWIATADIAERVIELYWPQTSLFAASGDAMVLRQNNGGQAEIVAAILRFRGRTMNDPSTPLERARRADPAGWRRLVDLVEWKLIEMPLPKLQRMGATDLPFLYRIGWDDGVRRRDLAEGEIRREVVMEEGAAGHLVRLAGLLRPLIQRQWSAMVARFNRGAVEDARLEEFLFGTERISLEPVRRPLRELQDNRCFYCGDALTARADVDHFIPWARHPDNGLANLVVADPRCNAAKREHLAAADHLRLWLRRFEPAGALDLAGIADLARWEHEPERTLAVARAIYLRLPSGVALWQLGDRFIEAAHGDLSSLLEPRTA